MSNLIAFDSARNFSARPANRRASPISPRESEVLALVADGLQNKDIAAALGIAPDTVRAFLRTASMKLVARDRHEAARLWMEQRVMAEEQEAA